MILGLNQYDTLDTSFHHLKQIKLSMSTSSLNYSRINLHNKVYLQMLNLFSYFSIQTAVLIQQQDFFVPKAPTYYLNLSIDEMNRNFIILILNPDSYTAVQPVFLSANRRPLLYRVSFRIVRCTMMDKTELSLAMTSAPGLFWDHPSFSGL